MTDQPQPQPLPLDMPKGLKAGDEFAIRDMTGREIGTAKVVGLFPDPLEPTKRVQVGCERISIEPEFKDMYPELWLYPLWIASDSD